MFGRYVEEILWDGLEIKIDQLNRSLFIEIE